MASSSQNPGGDVEFIKLLDRTKALDIFNSEKCPVGDYSINDRLQRIQGSLVGLAVGDALGAPVEFRPREYLKANEVKDMQSGGTWGLKEGYWTDDTSMMLCLAASLIIKGGFDSYDQFQRYRRWYRDGYLSSTGNCFDIGKSTREAVIEFEKLHKQFEDELKKDRIDTKNPQFEKQIREKFKRHKSGLKLGQNDAAGNGPLMRLAPLPCFFYKNYGDVEKYIDEATRLTHGSQKAVDACKFYAGLITYALMKKPKEELLDPNFYKHTLKLKLDPDVQKVAEGSYKVKNGYDGGIRGKGYVVDSLEAALWALSNDNNCFKTGVLLAVNLGDDTDTTAAIYGQLAGAIYGIEKIPKEWTSKVYKYDFIIAIANSLYAVKKSIEKKSNDPSWSDDEAKEHGDGTYPTRHPASKGNSQANDNKKIEDNDRNKNKNNRSDPKNPKDNEQKCPDNKPNNNDSNSNKTEKSEKSSDNGKKGNGNAPANDPPRKNMLNE